MSWAYQWHSVTMSISWIFTCLICFVSIIRTSVQRMNMPKKHLRFSATIYFFTSPSAVCCGIPLKMMMDTLGLEVNIQRAPCIYIYISTHLKRIPHTVYQQSIHVFIFSHTYIINIYIYILCCTCFLKTYIPPSIVFICIYKPSIRPLSFTSTLPPSGKTCVIFVALMASSSCRPHPWHVAPC